MTALSGNFTGVYGVHAYQLTPLLASYYSSLSAPSLLLSSLPPTLSDNLNV